MAAKALAEVRTARAARHERVDGEWSFAETLRHLVFIADAWASRTVLDQPMPYHRLGVTQAAYAPADAAALGIDVDACPPLAEVMKARADRLALVRGIVDGLTGTGLERMCARAFEGARSVGECLGVVTSLRRSRLMSSTSCWLAPDLTGRPLRPGRSPRTGGPARRHRGRHHRLGRRE
jgi:DinB superfamily